MQKCKRNLASIVKNVTAGTDVLVSQFRNLRFSQIRLSGLHLWALKVKQCDIHWLILLSITPERHHKESDNKRVFIPH